MWLTIKKKKQQGTTSENQKIFQPTSVVTIDVADLDGDKAADCCYADGILTHNIDRTMARTELRTKLESVNDPNATAIAEQATANHRVAFKRLF